jgi:molybdopterin-containing oxidoreductase family iron-sulfur binding subunit
VRERLARTPPGAAPLRALLDAHLPGAVVSRTGVPIETMERLAREFAAGPSVAVAGGMGAQHANAAFTAAAVHILNYVTGNVGRTVTFDAQANLPGSGHAQLATLVQDMEAQRVQVLLVRDANPVYASPAGAAFADGMGSVPFKVSFSRVLDETTRLADLVLPDHDPLEQWNDSTPRAGIYALQQPVMQPVFDTRQTGDVLLTVARGLGGNAARRLPAESYEAYLKEAWRGIQRSVADTRPFDVFWNDALGAGGVFRPARSRAVTLAASAARIRDAGPQAVDGKLTLIAYPTAAFHDGRAANRPWLQELPDPVSKITWSSWVEIHPDTARQMGIAAGDHVTVSSDAGSVTVPAYVYEGIRPDVVAIPLGQGHTSFGRYANGVGANAYGLLAATPTAFGGVNHHAAVTLQKTGGHERLATTEGSPRQMDRGLAQSVTLAALASGHVEEHAAHAAEVPEHVEHLLEEVQQEHYRDFLEHAPYSGEHPRWAMAIDLSRCTGCSACVTACYAENNIPHVGKGQVQRGREMSWLRIERYFEGGGDEPLTAEFLPMMCQHCGNAPCEPVCPVFAAYHTPDGLNAQVYNRCVGTRYCSNNCPYKVRYFNWYDFSEPEVGTYAWPEPLHLLLNPDVTVRSKGVMEKCTFCVQRIRGAQHGARMSATSIRDGDLQTACQQVCPANAIVFGDLNDANSRVAQLSRDDRGYHVLGTLNTRPGVTYLRRVRNVADA